MGRRKLPVGQRKDIVLGLRCDPGLKRKLDSIAKKRGLALVDVMREALREKAEKEAA